MFSVIIFYSLFYVSADMIFFWKSIIQMNSTRKKFQMMSESAAWSFKNSFDFFHYKEGIKFQKYKKSLSEAILFHISHLSQTVSVLSF